MPSESFFGNILSGGANRKAALLNVVASLLESGYGDQPEEAAQNITDLGNLFKVAGQEQKILSKSRLPQRMFEAMRRRQMRQQASSPDLPEELDAAKQFLATIPRNQ